MSEDTALHHRISLDGTGWLFKDFYGEDWRWRGSYKPDSRDLRGWKPGTVPGCPLNDLWALGEVPNPYVERNSLLVEWVPQRTWVYRRSFLVPADLAGRRARLSFEGVDYEATFFLNGIELGSHRGMYTPAAFEVENLLKYGEENLLAVVIEAAPYEQPQVGRTSRVSTHKSRMTYWWDFCPRMVHTGIWDSVFLEFSGPVRLEDVFIRPQLAGDFRQADVSVSITLDAAAHTRVEVLTELLFEGQVAASTCSRHALAPGLTYLNTSLELEDPHLWWPNGAGEQPLYQAAVTVRLAGEAEELGKTTDQRSISFGIRQLELLPNQGAPPEARAYTLEVNGRRLYMKGWNWVPLDVMYAAARPEKLERLMELARRAHVNILRVWGGGLIEKESFYELCDRLGILVWQEFIQSSSGIDNSPPTSQEYIDQLACEAEQIVPRRRNHPSLAIWGGGNELQSGPDTPLDEGHPALAALRDVVMRLDPDRAWLPTSPTGPVVSNSLENIARDPDSLHDVHGPWEYQGPTGQCELYNQASCLLHSEFGVEGITNLKSLNAAISPANQLPISLDNPYWFHLGAWWLKPRSWQETFGDLTEPADLVRATQFMQASGLRYAVESGRMRKYHCSGTLPWQFNEPYPMAACTSAVDYFGRPKPAYCAVAEAYRPLHLCARFPTFAWAGRERFSAEAWVCSSLETPVEAATLEVRIASMSGHVHLEHSQPVSFGPNQSVRLALVDFQLSGLPGEIFFLDLQLLDGQGECLSDYRQVFTRAASFAPLLSAPQTSLSIEHRDGELSITNTGAQAALFVWIEDGRPLDSPGSLYPDANYFCLFPGECREVCLEWSGVEPADRRVEISAWNTGAAWKVRC